MAAVRTTIVLELEIYRDNSALTPRTEWENVGDSTGDVFISATAGSPRYKNP